jgi:hypothetical protein
MLTLRNILAPCQMAMFIVMLVGVIGSGIPLIEIHAHGHEVSGHDHGWSTHDHGTATEHRASATDEDPELTGSSHLHDLSAPMVALVHSSIIDLVEVPRSQVTIPSILRPPDRIITPFRRPPRV